MKRLLISLIVVGVASGVSLAQPEYSEAEMMVFYQRVQGFDFQSGLQGFEFQNRGFNGGGFGFVYNFKHWVGLFQQTSFLGGVEQSGLRLRMINATQGLKLTKRGLADEKLNLYVKGGIGYVHHVFSLDGSEFGDSNMSFTAGGGAEIKMKEGIWLVLDGSRMALGLPQVSLDPNRDKWDSNWVFTTGVSFQF